jgi:hypothetical protein
MAPIKPVKAGNVSQVLGCGRSTLAPSHKGRLQSPRRLASNCFHGWAGDFSQVSLYLLSELARLPLDLLLEGRESERPAV